MASVFFVVIAFMLITYTILDGFDLGVGTVHWIIGRNLDERRRVLKAIGPFWDGNEVWLIASGGVLYLAFPLLYASSFSGFYLPLTIVLWLLMLRGISIEVRGHLTEPIWQNFYDFLFTMSGALLTIFFGAALGNVVRGVPLNSAGYFFEPLWTDFRAGENPGILDWYTILVGVMGLVTLANHGAHWLALKLVGELGQRARALCARLWWFVGALTAAGLVATVYVRPTITDNYRSPGPGWLLPVMVLGGLSGMRIFRARQRDVAAFVASSVYIAGMLGGIAFGMYPTLLPATTDAGLSLTVSNSAAGEYGLSVGIVWWTFAAVVTGGYFGYVYWLFRHRVGD